MPVTIRIYNNTAQLASKTIPDGAVSEIQAAFPAATAALSAEAFLAWAAPILRAELEMRGATEVGHEQTLLAGTAVDAFRQKFGANWT